MRLIFATNNRHKLEEVGAILGGAVSLSTPRDHGITEDIPETAPTLEGNALQKARYIYERTGLDCFSDDTGLEVAALDGEPGVRSARYAGDEHDSAANRALLLERLKDVSDRSGRFRTVIALILGGKEYLFEGEVRGTIDTTEKGDGGFGYDCIFTPDGYDRNFAQMSLDEKGVISHRGRAVVRLAAFLSDL